MTAANVQRVILSTFLIVLYFKQFKQNYTYPVWQQFSLSNLHVTKPLLLYVKTAKCCQIL